MPKATLLASLALPLLLIACRSNTPDPIAPPAEQTLATRPAPQGAKWAKKWWLSRHEQKLAQKDAMERVDLVFLGDSITHAWDQKGKAAWDTHYAPRHALNLGFSGDRTEHVLWRLENGAVDGIAPKVVVLMIGTNNTGQRKDDPAITAGGIQAILHQLQTRLPSTQILLLAVFPRGEQPDDPLRQINEGINTRIKAFADGKRIHWLDLNPLFLDDNGVLPKHIMKDGLHPNADQYPRWAEAMEPKLQELLGE